MSRGGEQDTSARLPVRTKLAFGCGQGVEVAATFVANTFLLFFLTNVVGIAPAAAGTIIFLSLIIDAIADPLIGSWSDRAKSRWGRRMPFMIVGLPVVGLSSLALFATPIGGGTMAAMAFSLLLNVVVRVGTSVFALPYSALTAELTSDYDERSSVNAYRMAFGFGATMAVLIPAFSLFFNSPAAYQSRGAYVQLGTLLASVVMIMGAVCIAGIFRSVTRGEAKNLAPLVPPRPVARDFVDLTQNKSFLLLFFSCLGAVVVAGSVGSLNLYAYRYFWRLPASLNQLPILSFQLGLLVGIFATAWLLRRLEKREVLFCGIATAALSQCGMYIPSLAAQSAQTPLPIMSAIVGASVLWGATNSLFFITFQSMLADAVDEHEEKFGHRCEGLFFSSVIFSQKAATGIGSLIAGGVLALAGVDVSAHGTPHVTSSSAQSLGAIWSLGHGLAFLALIPLIRRYRLSRSAHRRLIETLLARRAGMTAASADA